MNTPRGSIPCAMSCWRVNLPVVSTLDILPLETLSLQPVGTDIAQRGQHPFALPNRLARDVLRMIAMSSFTLRAFTNLQNPTSGESARQFVVLTQWRNNTYTR